MTQKLQPKGTGTSAQYVKLADGTYEPTIDENGSWVGPIGDDAVNQSHVTVYAAQLTTVGGAAAEAVTITGVKATDLAFVQIKDNGTGNVTLLQAACTLNTLTLTFSGNPGNDTVIYYQIVRAIA